MAEQKRRHAHLGTIPVAQGGHLTVSVTPEGLVCLGIPDGREYPLEDGPAAVLGMMIQLALQVAAQADRIRQGLTPAGIPRA